MKIAIIGAMEEEVSLLRSNITDKQMNEVAGCEFTSGQIGEKEVILLKSGIGKVNAAMSTTILLEKYKPDLIINTGSAGGYNPQLNIGDLVISTEVRHHDVDVTIFDYEYGQVPQMPPAFLADPSLIETALKAVKNIEGIQAVEGLIATGDSFMNDPERVEFVRNKFPNLQAVEMEAAAIAQVAYQFKVPFVIIRSLSDIAGQESNISFDEFLDKAAVNSANLVLEIVKSL
ncbi:5'-methylthioadenosine/S-adenosylhomocysteine nucleosidase [Bacillus sp. FJAT-49711]|uniref:5'-methylthioadenosine/S-adenosylhomocysteine nucleosidase n=1 Tax=Bacillus sp. FJAT-49711 TaxID=2833585 RepID=UPI001BCA2FBE|nr:5'-methylthioadenosine/S-adenosylhomocysteine nucleosidase [Bacillus sp. FJAT-49711]MBS4217069.1 5'-methylthioadenosine/S-adenosylhomocysteine nucleosidase [Bacillus sp. FJAT-49711]